MSQLDRERYGLCHGPNLHAKIETQLPNWLCPYFAATGRGLQERQRAGGCVPVRPSSIPKGLPWDARAIRWIVPRRFENTRLSV